MMEDETQLADRVVQLIGAMHDFLALIEYYGDLHTSQVIDGSFYLQKSAELSIMLGQIKEVDDRRSVLTRRLSEHYAMVLERWRKDARWVSTKIMREFYEQQTGL